MEKEKSVFPGYSPKFPQEVTFKDILRSYRDWFLGGPYDKGRLRWLLPKRKDPCGSFQVASCDTTTKD